MTGPGSQGEQLFDRRPIGRVNAAIRPQDSPVSVDQEVAAQLQGIFAFRHATDLSPARDHAQVSGDHTRPQESQPRGTPKLECRVYLSVRIGKDRDWQRSLRDVTRQNIRPAHRDCHDGDAGGAEFVEPVRHLDQVRLARDSGEVPQDDE